MSTRVRLHIDRLVLRGIPREQRDALVRGLHEQLSRALAEPAAIAKLKSRHTPSLRGSELKLAPDTSASELGGMVGRKLMQGLGG